MDTKPKQSEFWMNAKKDGTCAECSEEITIGERIVYDPKAFAAYCMTCGPAIAGDDPKDEEGTEANARSKYHSKAGSKTASKKKEKGRT